MKKIPPDPLKTFLNRIEQKNAELDQVTNHLSMEEKIFQEEKEWLQQFSDMLGMIERR